MKVCYFLLFLLLFYTPKINAQEQSPINSIKEFGFDDGLLPYDINSMVFDEDNWLWISGKTLNSESKQLSSASLVLQRFDGNQFYNVELPNESLLNYHHLRLEKFGDDNLLALFSKDYNFKLYSINTKTLKFTEIEGFNKLKINKNRTVNLLKWDNDFLLIGTTGNVSDFYKLDNSQTISKLTTYTSEKEDVLNFSEFIPLKNNYVVNNDREGIMLFDNNWNFKKWISSKEVGTEIRDGIKFRIRSYIKANEDFYFSFNNGDFYKYDEANNQWEKADSLNKFSQGFVNYVNEKQIVVIDKQAEGTYFSRSLDAKNILDKFFLKMKSGGVRVVSRDIKKEVFIFNNGRLFLVTFKNKLVETYLKGYSIRGICKLAENKFLVGTVSNGWFTVDTSKGKVNSYSLSLHNKLYKPHYNRGFQIDGDVLWSNDVNGVIEVDRNTHNVKSYIHYPVSCVVFEKDTIFYGTGSYNLMCFDKKKRQNIVLAKTDSLLFLDIEKKNDVIYGATDKGFFIYKDKKGRLLKLPSVILNYLVSLDYVKGYGLLIGTIHGELFQFNEADATFNLLYKDPLQSSIVSTTLLEENTLWINTFSGCVSFNTKTKEIKRFGENVGFSNDEANRYSFLKENDSLFLLGTVNGLNVFNPNKLAAKDSLQINFKGIGYFNEENEKWTLETAPEFVNNISAIELPANNHHLKINVATVGITPLGKVNYYYKINNNEWSKMLTNEVDFAQLSSGSHIIEIKAVGKPENIVSNVLTLKVNANSFIYERWWFYPLILSILIIIAYYYFKELMKRKNIQQHLSQSLINAQESERARLARDLHDGIGQQLILLKKKIQKQDTALASDTNEILEEMRGITKSLHPSILKQLGLTETLIQMINSVDEQTELFFTSDIQPIDGILTPDQEVNLYRIVQESVNNIVKHANATAVEINVLKHKHRIEVEIVDNGKGFNVEEKFIKSNSLGLQTLKERVNILKGDISFQSNENGTKVKIIIPFTKN